MTITLLHVDMLFQFSAKTLGPKQLFFVCEKHLQILALNSSMPLAPAGAQQKGSFRQDYKFVLVSCRILAFCENSKYYLSLKFNTVLLPETTLYSSLPQSLQPQGRQGILHRHIKWDLLFFFFLRKSFSSNCP